MPELFQKLPQEFYLRPTLEVARDLIGKVLVYRPARKIILKVRLVEVEAYIGRDDPACHAARGKTARNAVMFGPGGFSYIYFIYGMYHCLNFVTEPEGFPAAVLIRGGEPLEGIEVMRKNYQPKKNNRMTDGPGKLCKAFGLTREQNGLDLTGPRLYLEDHHLIQNKIESSKRVGIKVGRDKKWRFFDADSPYVSQIKKCK